MEPKEARERLDNTVGLGYVVNHPLSVAWKVFSDDYDCLRAEHAAMLNLLESMDDGTMIVFEPEFEVDEDGVS